MLGLLTRVGSLMGRIFVASRGFLGRPELYRVAGSYHLLWRRATTASLPCCSCRDATQSGRQGLVLRRDCRTRLNGWDASSARAQAWSCVLPLFPSR